MARRLELAFRSLERMRRFHGHFYNWYDLADLSVLEPAYVSTVDSGNLAGHLIALRQACLALIEEPALDARIWRALETALTLADERMQSVPSALPRRRIPARPASAALASPSGNRTSTASLARVAERSAVRDGAQRSRPRHRKQRMRHGSGSPGVFG